MSERQECWIVCDKCGKPSERYSTHTKAEINAILEGWAQVKSDWEPKHLCPQCKPQDKVQEVAA